MNVGMFARCDNRGLGHLTWEFHRHMRPDRTLVVLTNDPEFPEYPDRFSFGEKTMLPLGPSLSLSEADVREFLDGLDVVYTAETFYDWRIVDWAREMGVRTVVHGMPELCRHVRERGLPKPDQWWWPTEWMTDHRRLPDGTIVEIPCESRVSSAAASEDPGPLHILHPGGKHALADRDGTLIFIEAMGFVAEDVKVTLVAQDRDFDDLPDRPNVEWEVIRGVTDRWDMYRDQHVTVLPRRYGGLSLKVQESLACGVPVIMPRVDPNSRWPGPRVPAKPGKPILVPAGQLGTWNADPHAIADEVDALASDRSLVAVEHRLAHSWATNRTWAHLKPVYERALQAAA